MAGEKWRTCAAGQVAVTCKNGICAHFSVGRGVKMSRRSISWKKCH